MATSTHRSEHDVDVDLHARVANALLTRSHDICHQESDEAGAYTNLSSLSRFNSRDIRELSKDLDATLLPRDSLLYSEIDESTSSEAKSQSSRPSRRGTPSSPFTMSESLSSATSSPSSEPFPYSSLRLRPYTTSSYLRPGSRFEGTQQSDKQTYTVNVELKYVDIKESFLCGYLCIQGLTPDNPTLTTYFEGEMIGNKYAFKTKNKSWGANEKIDYQHWGRFPAYRPFSKTTKNKDYHTQEFDQKEYIFMRWKEYFLVPNHQVKELTGASFDGFYYICFSQRTGSVSGIYFHSNSERWQQLELQHVPDRGVFTSLEFR